MDKEYIDFFDYIKEIKEKQQKQKQRGLNNYNLLTTVLNAHDEVRLHSRVISSLLDTDGNHFQGELFLEKFFEVLNLKDFTDNYDLKNSKIFREYENIDLYLNDGTNHIIIENKIYAGDQEAQIKRYIKTIKKDAENKNLKYENILVIYLSIDREEPSEYSLKDLKIENGFICQNEEKLTFFKNINYNSEIIKWLRKCIYEVQNITNLNESLKQYLTVVEKITNKYKGKVMTIEEELIKEENREYLGMVLDFEDKIPKMRDKIVNDFFDEIEKELNDKLNTDIWKVEIKRDVLLKAWWSIIRVYKKDWKDDKKGYVFISFEFDNSKYKNGFFGVKRIDEKVDTNKIYTKFKNEIDVLISTYPSGKSQWWPFYKKSEIEDMPKEIVSKGYTVEKFKNSILELIENLEENNNLLLTRINKYIQNDYKEN